VNVDPKEQKLEANGCESIGEEFRPGGDVGGHRNLN